MTYDRQPKCVDNAIKYLFDDYDPYHNPVFAVWNKFFKLDIIRSHEITFNKVYHWVKTEYSFAIISYTPIDYCTLDKKAMYRYGVQARQVWCKL